MDQETRELTREELYGLVWQTPMNRLASQFGISGNGLAKICRRLDIPYPPRGWWAKKEAGKHVEISKLPNSRPNTAESVRIAPTPGEEGGLKSAIREQQRMLCEVAVPQRLTRAHPLIARWRDEHRKQFEEARRDPWRRSRHAVGAYTDVDRRRHRILHALFRVLEKHGASIAQGDRGEILATVAGEKIAFSLQEKSRQVTRPRTEQEKKWESWNSSGVKTVLEPTGYLHFSISAWIGQPFRKNWQESERRALDAMLPEIAATFLALGPLLAERTRQREERARIFAEQQRQWELERERQQQDDNRWKRFLELAEASQQAETARLFIARLRMIAAPRAELLHGRSLSEWLDWAEDRAKDGDPVEQGVEAVFGDIAGITAWSYRRY